MLMDRQQQELQNRVRQVVDQFKITTICKVLAIICILSCFASYAIAVSTGEELPFPYCSITQTFAHFPQCVFFRVFFGTGSLFFGFVMKIVFDILQTRASQLQVEKVSQFFRIMSYIAMCGLCITAATIDNGAIEHPYHDIGALTFFLLFNLIQFAITVQVYNMWKQYPLSFSIFSVITKMVLCILLLVLYAVEIILKVLHPSGFELPPDKYRNIVEWGSMLIFCSFLYTLSYDLKAATVQIDVKMYKTPKLNQDSEKQPILMMQPHQVQFIQPQQVAQNYVQLVPKFYYPMQAEVQQRFVQPQQNPNNATGNNSNENNSSNNNNNNNNNTNNNNNNNNGSANCPQMIEMKSQYPMLPNLGNQYLLQ